MKQQLCSLYKLYFEIENKDYRIYVKNFIIGGEPFIKVVPALEKDDAGIFEKDKAEKYIEIIKDEKLKMEEVKVYVE